ncbi:hypothetical protein BpHYR1_004991 [Brachionus plicatilis]|uniref:Uncharacterized protein n=1 Tax=Brachionus plicatilis TaxID=10195 RepID=A0A3M7S384_BRAPC|nr:hypothetical protein BpHYR1_004991 [Brachionus plicatilis]
MDTLENHLILSVQLLIEPDQEWIFQQDGAPAHTANSKLIKIWIFFFFDDRNNEQKDNPIEKKSLILTFCDILYVKSIALDNPRKYLEKFLQCASIEIKYSVSNIDYLTNLDKWNCGVYVAQYLKSLINSKTNLIFTEKNGVARLDLIRNEMLNELKRTIEKFCEETISNI